MWLGFGLASRLPVRVSPVVIVVFEIVALMAVRDGLVLDILSFVWPVQAIIDWQAGAYAPAP